MPKVFASPLTENPSVLLEDAPDSVSSETVERDDRTVNQNVIWASQASGRPCLWNLELNLNEDLLLLGSLTLPERPSPASKRLPFLAFAMTQEQGGSVIYVNRAADAETTAKQLFDLSGQRADVSNDPDIQNLIELVHKIVHRKYSLAEVLKRGIAFHYGNMPLVLRSEIERLFKENKIKFLVCTATLIEGVNLPCRAIFLRGPKKGMGRHMSALDFWNLAGRAGRWGKEFQGTVVCVDAKVRSVWATEPPRTRRKVKVERTVDSVLSNPAGIMTYIAENTPRDISAKQPNLEYTSAYLFAYVLSGRSIEDSVWAKRISKEQVFELCVLLKEKVNALRTPVEVITRNPGISPIAMDEFLAYLDDRYAEGKKKIDDLIPALPESNDAVSNYAGILGRINGKLSNEFGINKRIGQLALLTANWMNGYPLARIIANREQRYGSDNLAGLIRETMKDVEEFARFKIPKYLSCYTDLVRIHLQERGREDLVDRLFDAKILLEFGASQTTQLSLMSIGLSRSSAILLSELISATDLSEDGVIAWLSENEWMTESLPELIKKEISIVLQRASEFRAQMLKSQQ